MLQRGLVMEQGLLSPWAWGITMLGVIGLLGAPKVQRQVPILSAWCLGCVFGRHMAHSTLASLYSLPVGQLVAVHPGHGLVVMLPIPFIGRV